MKHAMGQAVFVGALVTLAICAMAESAWCADDTTSAACAAQRRGDSLTPVFVPTGEQVERAAGRACSGQRRCADRRWRFDVAIPLWIPGVSGSFASGGVTIDADLSAVDAIGDIASDISDIFGDLGDLGDFGDFGDFGGLDDVGDPLKVGSDLKFGFLASVQAHKGKWTIGLDGFGASLGTSVDFRLTDDRIVDATLWCLILRGAAKYEWLRRPVRMPWCGTGCLRSNLVAGGRFYGAGFEAVLPEGLTLKDSEQWVDPIVGLDLSLDLSRKFRLRVEGDVGGFGVGSDFAWWAIAGADWRFARRWTLMFAYAWLDVDYGSASDFAWNLQLQGPSLGLQFSF